MEARLFLIGGFLMAPICVIGLLWQWGIMWLICPQTLIVMFVRQSQHAYDSLGAADYPDLIAGALYYPCTGWLLNRAIKTGRFARVGSSAGLWHLVAIGVAWLAAQARNRWWGF